MEGGALSGGRALRGRGGYPWRANIGGPRSLNPGFPMVTPGSEVGQPAEVEAIYEQAQQKGGEGWFAWPRPVHTVYYLELLRSDVGSSIIGHCKRHPLLPRGVVIAAGIRDVPDSIQGRLEIGELGDDDISVELKAHERIRRMRDSSMGRRLRFQSAYCLGVYISNSASARRSSHMITRPLRRSPRRIRR